MTRTEWQLPHLECGKTVTKKKKDIKSIDNDVIGLSRQKLQFINLQVSILMNRDTPNVMLQYLIFQNQNLSLVMATCLSIRIVLNTWNTKAITTSGNVLGPVLLARLQNRLLSRLQRFFDRRRIVQYDWASASSIESSELHRRMVTSKTSTRDDLASQVTCVTVVD